MRYTVCGICDRNMQRGLFRSAGYCSTALSEHRILQYGFSGTFGIRPAAAGCMML